MKLEYAYLFDGEMYRTLLDSIPKGKYFDNRATIIPCEEVSEFRVTTEFVNEIHYVSINCENGKNQDFTFVPSSSSYVIRVKLPRGLNTITVLRNEQSYASKSYCSTYFGTLLYAYAKELNKATIRLDRLTRDIYKQESTRITSPVQEYSKQLSDKKAQRIFGLQLITRALVNSSGTFEALEDICKAIFISTPLVENAESKNIFDLSYYSFAGQEYELGKVIYLWVRNPGLVRRLYGLILANNFGLDINATDSTLEIDGADNEYEDSEEPLIVDDNGFTDYESEDEKGDGYLEISIKLDFEIPRLDRNLPIPFTSKMPWTDGKEWKYREHLDEGTSLDVATYEDPLNKGEIGKQYIPYRYDGSKVTNLVKVVKYNHINQGSMFIGEGNGEKSNIVYLTYFNEFNKTTGEDTPLIGTNSSKYAIISTNGPSYSIDKVDNVIKIGDTYVPALKLSDGNTGWGTLVYGAHIDENILSYLDGIFSVEFYANYSISNWGSFYYADSNGTVITHASVNRWSSDRGIGFWANIPNTRIVDSSFSFVGVTSGENQLLRNPSLANNTNVFYSFVIEVEQNTAKVRSYINGNLAAISNCGLPQTLLSQISASYGSTTISQLCIRKGDYSINDGDNYPVPTEPYMSF